MKRLINQDRLRAMVKLSIEYRGEILDNVILLESIMEKIICNYFTNNQEVKSIGLLYCLIGTKGFSLNYKREIIMFIIHNNPNIIKNAKKIDETLQDISNIRNMIAHHEILDNLNTIKNFNGDDLYFVDFKTKNHIARSQIEKLNKKKIKDIVENINKVKNTLIRFSETIGIKNR